MTSTETETPTETMPLGKQSRHHFLIATDGSPAATRAGDFAAQLAAEFDAHIVRPPAKGTP